MKCSGDTEHAFDQLHEESMLASLQEQTLQEEA